MGSWYFMYKINFFYCFQNGITSWCCYTLRPLTQTAWVGAAAAPAAAAAFPPLASAAAAALNGPPRWVSRFPNRYTTNLEYSLIAFKHA